MKCEDPNRKHETDTGRSPAEQEIEAYAQPGSYESGTEERDPEHVPWNPRRYQRSDGRESEEMVHSKHNEGHCEQIATRVRKPVRYRVEAR